MISNVQIFFLSDLQPPATALAFRPRNGFSKSREDASTRYPSPITFLKRFFVHDVRHFCRITAVVAFENVDESLYAAARHAFGWIDIQASDLPAAGEMIKEPATISDFRIKQWRIGWQRFFLEHIERCARDDLFF